MPLQPSVLDAALAPAIKANIQSFFDIQDQSILTQFCNAVSGAIATQVILHIQQNALVTGVVTSGAGAGGTVTGSVG